MTALWQCCCEGRSRTDDLKDMGLASYHLLHLAIFPQTTQNSLILHKYSVFSAKISIFFA